MQIAEEGNRPQPEKRQHTARHAQIEPESRPDPARRQYAEQIMPPVLLPPFMPGMAIHFPDRGEPGFLGRIAHLEPRQHRQQQSDTAQRDKHGAP